MLVDTEGFVPKVKVHSAKVMDYEGIKKLLQHADEKFDRQQPLPPGGFLRALPRRWVVERSFARISATTV